MTYLASPYSHPDPEVRAYRFRAACVAAAELMRRGEVVVSPIAHSHPIAVYGKLQGDFDTWSRLDMELLAACDKVAVLMLPGYAESEGVAREVSAAVTDGKPAVYLDPLYLCPIFTAYN